MAPSYDIRSYRWNYLYEKRRIEPERRRLVPRVEGGESLLNLSDQMLDEIEHELHGLMEKGSDSSVGRILEIVTTYGGVLRDRIVRRPESVQQKLTELFAEYPWMDPATIQKELIGVVTENASLRSRRRKVIMIADRVGAALTRYAACKPGCSHCCHMNTMIYEHEAIRLAEVTGRQMTRLPYRPLNEVALDGMAFDGQPCTFLVEGQCSVYADRPLVCRTHHSLADSGELCSSDPSAGIQARPPMYEPDILEVPYMELNQKHNPMEPWGNIAEFFPDV